MAWLYSRDILWMHLTIHPIIDSKIMSNEPPAVGEFGPLTVKRFGKLGIARER
jgi:hypothetical protein